MLQIRLNTSQGRTFKHVGICKAIFTGSYVLENFTAQWQILRVEFQVNFASSGLVAPHPESLESDEAKVLSFDGHDKFRFEDLLAEKNNIDK